MNLNKKHLFCKLFSGIKKPPEFNYALWIIISATLLLVLFVTFFVTYLIVRKKFRRFFYPSYNLGVNTRGLCIIIINEAFKPESALQKREGSMLDFLRLKYVFGALLGFEIKIEKNKSVEEMKKVLDEIRRKESLKSHSAFVCVVMSHGGQGDVIFGSDGQAIEINKITQYFNDKFCKSLRGKPKIFIINACRGGKLFLSINCLIVFTNY